MEVGGNANRLGLRERRKVRTQDALIDTALALFEQRGYDAVSVEQIAATAEVSVRTFYRYFPTKEDVLAVDPHAEAAARAVLADRHPSETDVDFVARAMITALTARRPDRVRRGYQLIRVTPALQARIYQLAWNDQEYLVDALIGGAPRTPDVELRARVIGHAVSSAIRAAVGLWIQAGEPGPLEEQCTRAIALLREAMTASSAPSSAARPTR